MLTKFLFGRRGVYRKVPKVKNKISVVLVVVMASVTVVLFAAVVLVVVMASVTVVLFAAVAVVLT